MELILPDDVIVGQLNDHELNSGFDAFLALHIKSDKAREYGVILSKRMNASRYWFFLKHIPYTSLIIMPGFNTHPLKTTILH